ncbi:MAG: hypothetical protein WBZ16_08090, partial [Pseudolabrys sp.]
SYTWVADQIGHICLGLIGNFAATALCGVVMKFLGWAPAFRYDTGKWPGLVIVAIGAAAWEWFAYTKSADEATKRFPLDKALLLANAQVAAAYMILGGVLGFAFHLHLTWALIVSLGVLVVAVLLAPLVVAAEDRLAKGGARVTGRLRIEKTQEERRIDIVVSANGTFVRVDLTKQ